MSHATLVCFAVEQEAAAFRKRLADSPHVHVIVTGMGRRNAQRAVTAALDGVSHVITSGFAGALDPALQIGDVLYQTSDREMAAKLQHAGARAGTFHCSEFIAVTAASKAALFASSKAHAVEMESEGIRQVCNGHHIPCTTVRAISDTAGEDLPLDFNRLVTSDQALSGWKLAVAILAAPHKIPALARLGRNSSRAAARLSDVLCRIV
jgi:nucleoside phosphorylase